MTKEQFQLLNANLSGIKESISEFKESSRQNLKDVNSSILSVATGLGEIRGEVKTLDRIVRNQEKTISNIATTNTRHDETLKTLKMKTTRDSWRIPILFLRTPWVKKVAVWLLFGLFVATVLAILLVLASYAGQEIVIKNPAI